MKVLGAMFEIVVLIWRTSIMETKKILFFCLVLVFFHGAGSQGFGVKGHLLFGGHTPVSSDFEEVYGGNSVVGGEALIGIDRIYLFGRFLSMNSDGSPVTVGNVAAGATSSWNQDLTVIGLRLYQGEGGINFTTSAGFVRSSFKEEFQLTNAAVGNFVDQYSGDESGFLMGLGLAVGIGLLSFEGSAEYIHVVTDGANGLVSGTANIGGFFFNLGVGVRLFGKESD